MLRALKRDGEQFYRDYPRLALWLALTVLIVYGGRIIHDDFFIDSEIMILKPDFMRYIWMGSNRFGMVASSKIFGLHRLSPWMSNILMGLMMWCSGLALAFCAYDWTGRSYRYRRFIVLFPILFLTAPIFVEQYLFVLQSFEISFALLLTIVAAFCSNRFARWNALTKQLRESKEKTERINEYVLTAIGLICLVWAFGTYQAMVPLYIALVLTSFLLGYLNGYADTALRYGICQMIFFLLGCLLYFAVATFTRRVSGTDSSYVSDIVRWRIDGIAGGIAALKTSLWTIFRGTNVFYRKYYFPAMCLYFLQALCYGWRKKKNIGNFGWFLLGGLLLAMSPLYLTLLTGSLLPVRTQLVYPLTSALFLAHLTVWPEKNEDAVEGIPQKKTEVKRAAVMAVTVFCAFCAVRQGGDTMQLFQTAWEVYRNDVLLANRMYPEICKAAQTEDMEQCIVVFTGARNAGVKGPAMRGQLAGMSMFEAEAHTAAGVSARIGCLFSILGMDMQVKPDDLELYHRAIAYMQNAPDWPMEGSIRKLEDVVVVRLSESLIPY